MIGKGRCLIVCDGRICINEEDVQCIVAQVELKVALAMPPLVPLPQCNIQLYNTNHTLS